MQRAEIRRPLPRYSSYQVIGATLIASVALAWALYLASLRGDSLIGATLLWLVPASAIALTAGSILLVVGR